MNRLTERNDKGCAYLVNVKKDEQVVESPYQNTLRCILDALERLAEYEDTGLDPEQLKRIDKIYKEKCEEVSRLSGQSLLNPAGEYALRFAENHGISIKEAMESPMVKARFDYFNSAAR